MRVVTKRASAATVAVLTCTVALGGCGSGAKKPAHSQAYDSLLAFSQCMRTHDVPNFPDPSAQGGIHVTANTSTSSFGAAHAACAHLLPGSGPQNPQPTRQEMAQALAVSRCMRAHGVSGFPDPSDTMPKDPNSYGLLLTTRQGVTFAVPATINTMAPAFQNAIPICHFGPRRF